MNKLVLDKIELFFFFYDFQVFFTCDFGWILEVEIGL